MKNTKLFSSTILCLLTTTFVMAQSSRLDQTFGSGGKVISGAITKIFNGFTTNGPLFSTKAKQFFADSV